MSDAIPTIDAVADQDLVARETTISIAPPPPTVKDTIPTPGIRYSPDVAGSDTIPAPGIKNSAIS
jgi:hypothetical protein